MGAMTEPITVERDDAHHRFRAMLGGELAGSSFYRVRPGKIIVYHTEVLPEYEGRGVGSVLAKLALDDIRAHGKQIVPECPFFARYIKHHPEYADLVTTL